MMGELCKGRYAARMASGARDLEAAQRLRHLAFLASRGVGRADGLDADDVDDACVHVLVEDVATGALVCCFRLLALDGGQDLHRSYAARHYDLSGLAAYAGAMTEVGRFCLHPGWHDPDILRIAWAAIARFVDLHRVEMLFGCSSFEGVDAAAHLDALALLNASHVGPCHWLPGVKAPEVIRFASAIVGRTADMRRAQRQMPPLLRTYLGMGGWVSDHAVIDRDLDTLHVFTGVEISAVPPARARLLRALVG